MSYRRLGFRSEHRRALLRNAVTSLLEHEKITTTETRGKEIKRIAEKMVTLGKKGDLHARRQAGAYIMNDEVVQKLFGTLADRYKDRQGGYTRLIKTANRKGDGAPMVIVEFVE